MALTGSSGPSLTAALTPERSTAAGRWASGSGGARRLGGLRACGGGGTSAVNVAATAGSVTETGHPGLGALREFVRHFVHG